MQSLTAIEKQLEDRCKKEIKEIVSRFISDVQKLKKTRPINLNK